jgi:hypothetical protein
VSKIEINPGVFVRFDATGPEVPVLIDVSRSSREYPHDFRSPHPFTGLHGNVSMVAQFAQPSSGSFDRGLHQMLTSSRRTLKPSAV